MLLIRSSSTPHIGTHWLPFSDSPTRDLDTTNKKCNKHPPLLFDHHSKKLSFSQVSCSSSTVSNGASHFSESSGFRRAWSDGNLEGLSYSGSYCDIEDFGNSTKPREFFHKHSKLTGTNMLQTSPSFSIFTSTDEFQDGENNNRLQDPSKEEQERTVTIGESIEAMGSGEFSFGNKKSMGFIEEAEEDEEEEGLNGIQNLSVEVGNEPGSPPMYLAAGLGIDSFSIGGGELDGDFLSPANFDDSSDVEEYYRKMVDQYPCHPLFLRNYAQVLQSKGDLQGAVEYYSRATLADPEDGEILVQYAKFVWENLNDQDRALSYFERAAQAAPQDSHVLAAYASFLWEIGGNGEEDEARQDHFQIEEEECKKEIEISTSKEEIGLVSPSLHLAAAPGMDVADSTADESSNVGNVEEYYKKMINESPNNPLFLRNYAQFLCQSKEDLPAAEEFYMRAILADPRDGEIISQYAKLVWELHHDRNKALCYFERAVEATPGDSFLWETEDEEEGDPMQDCIQIPLLHEQAMNAANIY
ncbi:hypothetical protein CFP56_041888, partial [Quercus suber]